MTITGFANRHPVVTAVAVDRYLTRRLGWRAPPPPRRPQSASPLSWLLLAPLALGAVLLFATWTLACVAWYGGRVAGRRLRGLPADDVDLVVPGYHIRRGDSPHPTAASPPAGSGGRRSP